MLRPYTDIATIKASEPIKNGSCVIGVQRTGKLKTLNTYVKNTPAITDIYNKYGNRFYNGILIYSSSTGVVDLEGGSSASYVINPDVNGGEA
jgi:hypothetical protein